MPHMYRFFLIYSQGFVVFGCFVIPHSEDMRVRCECKGVCVCGCLSSTCLYVYNELVTRPGCSLKVMQINSRAEFTLDKKSVGQRQRSNN